MTNYKVGGISVSDLIASGSTTTATSGAFFTGTNTTIAYNPSNKPFENPTEFGFKKNNTDIANSIQSTYKDYTSSTTLNSADISGWCTQLRIVAIGGGGGGGGGGGDPGGSIGVSGSGGGGGGLAAAYINVATYGPPYVLTIGSGGAGGAAQYTPNSPGNPGSDGGITSVKYGTNTEIITANGGNGGNGGTDPNSTTNTTAGVNGGNGTILAAIGTKYTETGNSSNTANDGGPSQGGTNNYGNSVPILANNSTSNTNSWQTPGKGQGGIGGINSGNSNGYAGQNGGGGFVRIYFIK